MKFEELALSDNILDALWDMHFDECTPIQEAAIPVILDRKDFLGCAQTGTGKTAAYLLPILSLIDEGDFPKDKINCLIMSPTRELAQQIDQAMQGFAYYCDGIGSIPIYGGNDGDRYSQELKSLRMGADVVIATPGRLISHIAMGNIDFSQVSFFVLDEADRMLDMGFSEDILQIARMLPEKHQTIMFSATMPAKIQQLAETLLHEPEIVKLSVSKPAEKIRQSCVYCEDVVKLKAVDYLFRNDNLSRTIIFAGSKDKVKEITRSLTRHHINCGQMHSDLTQKERDEMMFRFKSGQIDVIVATDILARGIDIDDIQMVINFDVPHDAEDYVHRIGRTARAEKDGRAVTFVSNYDLRDFQQIERFLESRISIDEEISKAVGAPLEAPALPGKKKRKNKSRKNNAKGKGKQQQGQKKKKTFHGNESQKPNAAKDNAKAGKRNNRKGKTVHPIKQPDKSRS